MAFEEKLKRRPWTQEEKQSALKSCASRCACCGTKLNMKTLTMEHVVPISKGGENKLENLVVLCNKCNSSKGNKFCWPLGYYMSLNDKGKLNAINKYTELWVDKNITADYLNTYPMIAESISFYIQPKHMNYNFKNGSYIPSLILDVTEIGPEDIHKYPVTMKDVYACVKNRYDSFSLVAATKRSDGKCIGLFVLQLTKDALFINEVWTSNIKVNWMVPFGLINAMCETWNKLGADIIVVQSHEERAIREMLNSNPHFPLKCYANSYDMFDYPGKENSYYGKNQILIKTLGREDTDFTDVINGVKERLRA